MNKSKQINFYATTDEIFRAEKELIGLDYTVVSQPIYDEKNITRSISLKEAYEKRQGWPFHYRLTTEFFMNHIILRYVDKQKYFLIDSMRSPVIDLTLSFISDDGKYINRGRLYYQSGYFGEDNAWKYKDTAFLNWADNFLRQFTSAIKFKKDEYDNIISLKADALIKEKKVECRQ